MPRQGGPSSSPRSALLTRGNLAEVRLAIWAHAASRRRMVASDVRLGAVAGPGQPRSRRHGLLVPRPDGTRAGLPPGRADVGAVGALASILETVAHTAMGASIPSSIATTPSLLLNAATPRSPPASTARLEGGSRRGRHRAPARQVGPARPALVHARRAPRCISPMSSSPTPRSSLTTTASGTPARATPITYGATLLDRATRRTSPPRLSGGHRAGPILLVCQPPGAGDQANLVIRAYAEVPGSVPLLIVGDAPYAVDYKAQLARLAAADPACVSPAPCTARPTWTSNVAPWPTSRRPPSAGTTPALLRPWPPGNLRPSPSACAGEPRGRPGARSAILFDDQAQLTAALTGVVQAPNSPEHQVLRTDARARAEIDLLLARRRRPVRGAIPGVGASIRCQEIVAGDPPSSAWGWRAFLRSGSCPREAVLPHCDRRAHSLTHRVHDDERA